MDKESALLNLREVIDTCSEYGLALNLKNVFFFKNAYTIPCPYHRKSENLFNPCKD